MLTAGKGSPLAIVSSGANRTDMKKPGDLRDARVYVVTTHEERHLCLDRGYDYAACRETATAHGYTTHLPPKRSKDHPLPAPGDPDRHPPRRWVVAVGHSWFNRFRRLLLRWDKQAAHYLGFRQLAAILSFYRKLRHARSLPG